MIKKIHLLIILLILLMASVNAAEVKSVIDFGAKCDNETDDFLSLKRAFEEQKGLALKLPEGKICYTSKGLVMLRGSLYSEAGVLQNPAVGLGGSGGGMVRCGPLRQGEACLKVTGGGAVGGSGLLHNVGVIGTGHPAPGQIGILVTSTYNTVLDGVMVYNQAVGIKTQAIGVEGISTKFHNVETCRITENDLIVDSIPETRINMNRFGCNGDTVTRTGSYISIQGGGPGPNGLFVFNSQFNAGAGGARCFISFEKMGVGQRSGIISEWVFVGNHFESGHPGESGICSDNSVDVIQRLSMSNNWFLNSGSGNKFLSLDSRTQILNWDFIGNHFEGWTGGFGINSTQPTYNLILMGNHFANTPFIMNAIWPSTLLAEPNMFEGVILSGSFYHEGAARIGGINNGYLINSSTGIKVGF